MAKHYLVIYLCTKQIIAPQASLCLGGGGEALRSGARFPGTRVTGAPAPRPPDPGARDPEAEEPRAEAAGEPRTPGSLACEGPPGAASTGASSPGEKGDAPGGSYP